MLGLLVLSYWKTTSSFPYWDSYGTAVTKFSRVATRRSSPAPSGLSLLLPSRTSALKCQSSCSHLWFQDTYFSLVLKWIIKLKGAVFYSSPEADTDTHLMAALKLRSIVFLWMPGLCKWIGSSVPQAQYLKRTISNIWTACTFQEFCYDALKLPFAWFWTFV